MQTETPLYVSDVLGEIDNPETAVVEPEIQSTQRAVRGPALFIADRRRAARRDGERGSIFEWLALGILAAVIIAALAASGIGATFTGAITDVVGKITGIDTNGKAPTPEQVHNCKKDEKWDAGSNTCKKK